MSRLRNFVVFFLYLGFNVAVVRCSFHNVGVRYKVSADVYSGRDNLEWEIDDKNPLFSQITSALNKGPPTKMQEGLGYRGFTVEASNAIGQQAWKTVGRRSDRALESLLLDSCPKGQMSQSVSRHIQSGIIGHMNKPVAQKFTLTIDGGEDESISIKHRVSLYGRRKKRQAAGTCSTSFMPENWNYRSARRRNNCYNYATNRQTNTFAQPGRASGFKYQRNTARDVYAAAIRDGLMPLTTPNAGRNCLIVLVIWPDEDYHFLRLDNNGYWSQKSGRTRARNVDDSGNRITDPRVADLGPYVVLAGWLGVGPNVYVQ